MIRAKSRIKTRVVNGKELPVVKDFTQEVWKRLPSVQTEDGVLPKMGFVKMVSEGEVLVEKEKIAPAAPAKKKAPKNTGLSDELAGHAATIEGIKSDNVDSLNAKEDIQPLAKALGIKYNQPKSKLVEEIKKELNDQGVL